MAVSETIQEILQGIDDAQYGRDMRQLIHKGIQKCYEEGSAGETDLEARESIEKILEIFGDVEDGDTASKAYAVGDSVVYDGRLYKVITAIAQGDTLTEGTNIEETTATSNVGDLYELPFGVSGGTSNNSKLYIIPSIKLMIFNILYDASAGSLPTLIGTELPIICGAKAAATLYKPTVNVPVTLRATDNSGDMLFGYAELTIGSDDNNVNLNMVYSGTTTKNMRIKGTMVAPYTRLNTNHPFSQATLVTE